MPPQGELPKMLRYSKAHGTPPVTGQGRRLDSPMKETPGVLFPTCFLKTISQEPLYSPNWASVFSKKKENQHISRSAPQYFCWVRLINPCPCLGHFDSCLILSLTRDLLLSITPFCQIYKRNCSLFNTYFVH